MHFSLPLLLGAFSLASAQKIELDKIAKYPGPELVSAPLIVESDTPPDIPAPPVEPIEKPPTRRRARRSSFAEIAKRDGDCSPEPVGAGPVPTPDTAEAFLTYSSLQTLATDAPTPDGYAVSFTNEDGSLSASNYMGLTTLDSYDALGCASLCDRAEGCEAFNLYAERDPSLHTNPDTCPNPASTTNFKCTLWGAPVSQAQATNIGQWRDSFHVVIAASNAYNKDAPPDPIDGYTEPTELGGAIQAPLDAQGHDTYMGFQYFPFSQSQGYSPQTCADACDAQTVYNSQHPAADGSYQTCVFFNAYVLSKNAVPQGLYCTLYDATWSRSYGTNYGQYRGSDRYTVSRSYSYSLKNPPSTPGGGTCSTPAKIINPGFEQGSSAAGVPIGWNVRAPDDVPFSTVSPGSTLGGGSSKAFRATVGPSALTLAKSLTLSQAVPTCPGKTYAIDYQYKFSGSTGNYCMLDVSYPPNHGGTGISSLNPDQPPGAWYAYQTVFTAVSASSVLEFLVDCRAETAGVELDNIVVTEVV